jgi:hypothetical protein
MYMSKKLKKPTIKLVKAYLRRFEQKAKYVNSDKALLRLLQAFPQNDRLEIVLLRAYPNNPEQRNVIMEQTR